MDSHTERISDFGEGIDPQRPSAARVYDFFLGGTHNFAADRAAAAAAVQAMPELPAVMRTNRDFLRRAVRHVAQEGIDQYIDLGSGIPTVGNVHEIARTIHPEAAVVYVDVDPIAVVHSRSILADDKRSVVLHGDLIDADLVLDDPAVRQLIDFSRPVCLLLVAVSHFIPDTEALIRVLGRYREALAKGSFLILSHASDEGSPAEAEQARQVYNRTTSPLVLRSRAEVMHLLDGWQLVEPGLCSSGEWHPEVDDALGSAATTAASRSVLAAVGRKA
jgi:hypothetical protein